MTDEIGSCSRCGLVFGLEHNQCASFTGDTEVADIDVLACRNREIANLRAFLRGALRKLERCRDVIDEAAELLS